MGQMSESFTRISTQWSQREQLFLERMVIFGKGSGGTHCIMAVKVIQNDLQQDQLAGGSKQKPVVRHRNQDQETVERSEWTI